MSINVKKLINLLKGKSSTILWTLRDGEYLVGNRMFVARFDKVPHDLMSFLCGVFLRTPNENETLKLICGDVQEKTDLIDYSKIYRPDEATVEGKITAFSKETGDKLQAKVIDFGDAVSLVNILYTSLTDDHRVYGTGNSFAPIYMANKDLLVLPFRTTAEGQEELIKVITRFEYQLNSNLG